MKFIILIIQLLDRDLFKLKFLRTYPILRESKYGDNILILADFKFLYSRDSIMKEMRHVVELHRLALSLEEAKRRRDFALVLEMYNRIIVLKQQISNRYGIAKSMTEKGNFLYNMGFPQQALEMYVDASNILENTTPTVTSRTSQFTI